MSLTPHGAQWQASDKIHKITVLTMPLKQMNKIKAYDKLKFRAQLNLCNKTFIALKRTKVQRNTIY